MPYLAATCTPIELTKLRTSEKLIAIARKLFDGSVGSAPELKNREDVSNEQPTQELEDLAWSDEREEAGEKDGARRLHQRPVERPRVERLMQEGEGGGERRRILVANRRSRDEEERGVQDGDADPVQGDGKHGRGLLRCASIPIRAQDGWVGGQEADARGSVQGWEAVAGTQRLEAFRCDGRVEEVGQAKHKRESRGKASRSTPGDGKRKEDHQQW